MSYQDEAVAFGRFSGRTRIGPDLLQQAATAPSYVTMFDNDDGDQNSIGGIDAV